MTDQQLNNTVIRITEPLSPKECTRIFSGWRAAPKIPPAPTGKILVEGFDFRFNEFGQVESLNG